MSLTFVLASLGIALYMQRNVALHEKARAEAALREVRQTLSRSDFLQAVQLLDKERDSEALAYLSRALRTDPANAAAADLTLSLLTRRNWPLPVGSAFRLEEMEAAFSDHQAESVFGAATDETWSLWRTLDGRRVAGPAANAGRISYADFSPDGRGVVTASTVLEKNEAFGQVWDARSGAPITRSFPLKSGELSVKFGPDGKTILSAAGTTVGTWDAKTGRQLPLTIELGDVVNFAVWDPAGKRIATARLFEVLLWDARTSELAAAPLKQDALTRILTFSPDGEKLGIALYDNTARLWDPRTGEQEVVLFHTLARLATPPSAQMVTGFSQHRSTAPHGCGRPRMPGPPGRLSSTKPRSISARSVPMAAALSPPRQTARRASGMRPTLANSRSLCSTKMM